MNKLKVMSWLWSQPNGRAKYTAEHVNIWAAMVRRHLTIPHTISIVTDMPDGIDSNIEIIEPPTDFLNIETPSWNGDKPNCFRRLSLYSPDAEKIFGAKRFVSMDLDCVICQNIDELFDRNDDIVLYKGTSFERPYNGSMVLMTAGARTKVYNDFSLKNAIKSGQKFVGSDQAWLAYCLGSGEKTWDFEDGVYWYGSKYNGEKDKCKIIFFPGNPKPWNLVTSGVDNFLNLWYKGDRDDKCLILGYNKNVWQELDIKISEGPFGSVIASPETSKYLDFEPLAVAASDEQAEIIAEMYGFKKHNITFCGRTENVLS